MMSMGTILGWFNSILKSELKKTIFNSDYFHNLVVRVTLPSHRQQNIFQD